MEGDCNFLSPFIDVPSPLSETEQQEAINLLREAISWVGQPARTVGDVLDSGEVRFKIARFLSLSQLKPINVLN